MIIIILFLLVAGYCGQTSSREGTLQAVFSVLIEQGAAACMHACKLSQPNSAAKHQRNTKGFDYCLLMRCSN